MVAQLAKPNPTNLRSPPVGWQFYAKSVPLRPVHKQFLALLCVCLLLTTLFQPVTSVPSLTHHSSPAQSANVTSSVQIERPQRPISPLAKRVRRFLSFDTPMVDQNQLPMLYIGEVALDQYPQCQSWLEPYLNQCQRQYEFFLQSQIGRRYQKHQQAVQKRMQTSVSEGRPVKPAKPFSIDRDADYVKHASCCGMWQARTCVVDSIERDRNSALRDRVCPHDLAQRYRQLPSDPKDRVQVLDYCSEYGDGSLICLHAVSHAPTHSHHPLVHPMGAILLAIGLTYALPRILLH